MSSITKRELHSTGHGSDHYGKCDQCGKHVSETFVSKVLTHYTRPDGTTFWAGLDGGAYGHQECLIKHFGAHEERQLRATS